jgi:hypothetical protein
VNKGRVCEGGLGARLRSWVAPPRVCVVGPLGSLSHEMQNPYSLIALEKHHSTLFLCSQVLCDTLVARWSVAVRRNHRPTTPSQISASREKTASRRHRSGGKQGQGSWQRLDDLGRVEEHTHVVTGCATVEERCRGSLPSDSKFVSIVCRAWMVSSGDNEIYTGSSLRGVTPYIQCRAVVFSS